MLPKRKVMVAVGLEVKFCPCNFEDDMEMVKKALMNRKDIRVWEERCLLYCGQCLVEPFAVVNGVNITANSPEELLEELEKRI
ncbi:DUF1450 domain-containing protein [Bacillus tuaregi]|uniref:DUF1450 domain-containing protein n=1 Tax=Bacillus tuaregi TaxID=1816695 RepID=UPI000A02F015|nr:DUF1450 domain-containing protein [Bacillus tuaregi]